MQYLGQIENLNLEDLEKKLLDHKACAPATLSHRNISGIHVTARGSFRDKV